jgi:senataxin
LRRIFSSSLGADYERLVEVSSVDGYQGREANIVILSFLSDVRRMNVALTRAKYFLFVIANTRSISVNPYWRDLVEQAGTAKAVIQVPLSKKLFSFPDLSTLRT